MTPPHNHVSPARKRASFIVIAIDGPAASGKSSTAHWVAERLGYRHIDSGAVYRAATAATMHYGESPELWTEEIVLARAAAIALRERGDSFEPVLEGVPMEDMIRGLDVTHNVSRVARMPAVRLWVDERVRAAAEGFNVVADGRDIGTVVFPHADLKIFLVADSWERARRRLTQRLSRRPTDTEIAVETELLVQRDARDAMQTMQAKDAVLIDTTYLTQEEQVERIVALAQAVTQRQGDTSPG